MKIDITVDGPAGAGKSTIAKLVAEKLDLIYIDTGAMYRAVALYMLTNNIDSEEHKRVAKAIEEIDIDLKKDSIFLNGIDVSVEIRKPEISMQASKFAKIKEVRDKLLILQRKLASENSVIMDGRDIGSRVLPDARLKIFLTASVLVRARRRYEELLKKGIKTDLESVAKDIEARDEEDRNREIAPLVRPKDSIEIDTSNLTIEEVVNAIIKFAEEVTK